MIALYSAGIEYGIHCLLFLADEKSDSRESSMRILAELRGAPPELLIKVFTHLAKAGLVVATKGIHGGFRLTRPASGVSVLDVVYAIDSNKSIFECREVRGRCAIFEGNPSSWATHNTCLIHAVMLTTQKHTGEALAQQTTLGLVRRVGHIAPPKFGGEVLRQMDASREGRGGPRDQPLTYTERRCKPVSRKTPLSTAVLVAPVLLPTLSLEAAAEWPPTHCNDP